MTPEWHITVGCQQDDVVDNVFEFDRVRLSVEGKTILDDVSAHVPAEGITMILGPSGAGKSTLLRLCNRLEVATSGSVRFRGVDVLDLDPLQLRRRVGMVFQRPTLFDGTVRDNLEVADPSASLGHMAEVLERAALGVDILDADGDRLSGGEAQRVCLARTLLTAPEVLLLDEPTSALDPAATRQLETTVRSLAANGIPVLWVTHQLEQVERVRPIHRIVLVGGRLATVHEVIHYELAEPFDHDHDRDQAGGHDDAI
jgi:putative ABC transport system ATP-binding protein